MILFSTIQLLSDSPWYTSRTSSTNSILFLCILILLHTVNYLTGISRQPRECMIFQRKSRYLLRLQFEQSFMVFWFGILTCYGKVISNRNPKNWKFPVSILVWTLNDWWLVMMNWTILQIVNNTTVACTSNGLNWGLFVFIQEFGWHPYPWNLVIIERTT